MEDEINKTVKMDENKELNIKIDLKQANPELQIEKEGFENENQGIHHTLQNENEELYYKYDELENKNEDNLEDDIYGDIGDFDLGTEIEKVNIMYYT